MDREARDAQQRAREIDAARVRVAARLAQRHAAREREIAIEPGVQQHAAVGLDRELAVAVRASTSAQRLERAGSANRCARRRCGSRPRPASSLPTWNATRLPPPRTTVARGRRARAPRARSRRSRGSRRASSRRTASATAWYGVGDASMNASRSRAASGMRARVAAHRVECSALGSATCEGGSERHDDGGHDCAEESPTSPR